jgi:hypothetical protein
MSWAIGSKPGQQPPFAASRAALFALTSTGRVDCNTRDTFDPTSSSLVGVFFASARLQEVRLRDFFWRKDLTPVAVLDDCLVVPLLHPICICKQFLGGENPPFVRSRRFARLIAARMVFV